MRKKTAVEFINFNQPGGCFRLSPGGIEMKQSYLFVKYDLFLDAIVRYMSKGYYYYCVLTLPEKKKEFWGKTDHKIIEKYHIEKSKDQRYRLKKKGYALYSYLRYEGMGVILQTDGFIPEDINHDDNFNDIRNKPLFVRVTDLSSFFVYMRKGKHISIRMTDEMYNKIKEKAANVASTTKKKYLIDEFRKLYHLPSKRSGIIRQIRILATYFVKLARSNGIKIKKEELLERRILSPKKSFK